MAYSRPRTTGTITPKDLQTYLQGLANRNASAASQPYTFWSGGKQGASLSQSQLATVMRNFGYSGKQIRQAQTGSWGQGGVGGVLRSISGALVGLGPEYPAASKVMDVIFGAGEAATVEAPKPEDIRPSRTTSTGETPVRPTRISPTEVPKDTTDTTPPPDTTTEPGPIRRSIGTAGRGLLPTIPTTQTGTGLLDGIGSTLDFLKWIAWLFHPLNILRAVEFITGLATMYYGLSTLLGVMRRGSATHRTTVRSLLAATPFGKAQAVRRARRRGRRAGEVQAERDVAYRGARQERARSVGAQPRRLTDSTGGTGGTGGTGVET